MLKKHPFINELPIPKDVQYKIADLCVPKFAHKAQLKYDFDYCKKKDTIEEMFKLILAKCYTTDCTASKLKPEQLVSNAIEAILDLQFSLTFEGQMFITCYLYQLFDIMKSTNTCFRFKEGCSVQCTRNIQKYFDNLQELALPKSKPFYSGVFSLTLKSEPKDPMLPDFQLPNFLVVKYAKNDPMITYVEYMIGLYVNKLRKFIPNFVFTYCLLHCYPPYDMATWKFDQQYLCRKNTNKDWNTSTQIEPMIMMENTMNWDPLRTYLEKNNFSKQQYNELLLCLLLQVYCADNMAVHMLQVTHNDLHGQNILIQGTDIQTTIVYNLKLPSQTNQKKFQYLSLSLTSQIIVRIIDLGMASMYHNGITFGVGASQHSIKNYAPAHESLWDPKKGLLASPTIVSLFNTLEEIPSGLSDDLKMAHGLKTLTLNYEKASSSLFLDKLLRLVAWAKSNNLIREDTTWFKLEEKNITEADYNKLVQQLNPSK